MGGYRKFFQVITMVSPPSGRPCLSGPPSTNYKGGPLFLGRTTARERHVFNNARRNFQIALKKAPPPFIAPTSNSLDEG